MASPARLKLIFAFFLLFAASATSAQVSTLSLDGDWRFLADPSGNLTVSQLATVPNSLPTRIPSSWQSQFADLRDYAGVAWYWRTVTVAPLAADQAAVLHFGAVDFAAQVFVNGQKAGSHEGGYLPFDLEVTSLLHSGDNQIAVRVVDPGAKPNNLVEGINYAEIPHGKQDWYVQTSGLWQSVELQFRPHARLGTVHVAAAIDGTFGVTAPVIVSGPSAAVAVSAEIIDPLGRSVWKSSADAPAWTGVVKLGGSLQYPAVWTPTDPRLYELRVTTSSGDSQKIKFGFRSFTTENGKFLLNGNPIYLRGALDQDFYPDSIYTPPSLDFLVAEMREAKALGFNLLRCHMKVPDPRYLEAADEVGMLVWYEIPNWDKLTPDSERRALETLHGMVERDSNHPAVVIVSLMNEGWGAVLKSAPDRLWLKSAYQQAKAFVPWLVVDNSPCCEGFHLATDIADFHEYAAIPDQASDFDRVIDDMSQRPGWLFSPYGDADATATAPLMTSEFGSWGLPDLPQDLPWWLTHVPSGKDIANPDGIAQRFSDYQFNLLFPDLKSLTTATTWREFDALNYEIGAVRSHPEIQGYVLTQLTDVNWEANGVLDIWRHPKPFADALKQIQTDDLLVLRDDKRNYKSGEPVSAEAFVSHLSSGDLIGAEVDWQLEGTTLAGAVPVNTLHSDDAAKAGNIAFTAPTVSKPSKLVLKARLAQSNKAVSEASLNLFVYPNKPPDLPPPVSFYDPAPSRLRRLVNDMHGRGYLAPSGAESFPVLIASTLDDTVKAKLRDGARVILIANDPMTLAPGIEIATRRSAELSGNWISNFLWVRTNHAPFSEIGFDTLPGFETQAVTPAAVVRGIPPQNFKDVLAGMFYGWLRENDGVLVQAKAGKGRLLICTFSLGTAYDSDPYATYLMDALVSYAATDFKPQFELPLQ